MSERSSGPIESDPVITGDSPPIEVGNGPFGLTGSDDEDSSPTVPPSRTRVIVLSSLLALGLAGAAVMGLTAWRISSQKDATITAPQQVSGLRLDDSETGRQTAEYLTTALAAEVDLDKTVGAVYTDPSAADRGVLFFGGTALIWTPESDLDTAFGLIADAQSTVTDVHDVDAGDLGGTMKCGTTTSDDGDIAVCGWADHGSLALAMFPHRTPDDSEQLLRDFRAAAQTRD